MKKLLSLVLVLIIAMSVVFTVSATDGMSAGTAIPFPSEEVSTPSLDEAFNAFADFLKLESIMVYVNAFHEALGGFYQQLDTWLRALGVVLNGVLSGIFAG